MVATIILDLYSGVGKTPFQSSTQAIYLVAENETTKHQIINVETKSKLCSKRKHGSNIECQHEGECFASALPILIWPAILARRTVGKTELSGFG